MKIVDRLFIRLLTRLTLARATRHSDIAADLAAAHGADLAGVLADIDRLRRLLDVRVERVRVFVDDYSTDVPNLPQAEHLAMSLDEAAHEWSTVRLKGISGRYDRMVDADNEIANLKVQLDAANAARANGGSANAEELERFHAWALKLSGLPSKNNPSHEAVRTTVSRNHELMLAAHNELTAKSAEQARKLKQWEHGSEQLPAQPAETQQTICKWAFEIFGECTPERAAIRAGEEMGEFMAVLGPRGVHEFGRRGTLTNEQNAQLMKEAADVVVCLYRVADLLGQDLHKEIDRVMTINHGRQWARDGKGCGYHVKTTQEMVDAGAEATTGPFERVREVLGHHHAVGDGPCDTEGCERFSPRTEVSEVEPAFFDDEIETLPARELAALRQQNADITQREAALRMGVARLLGYECELSLTGVRKMVSDLDVYTDARKGWISFDIPNKANTKETVWGSVMSIMMVQGLEQSLASTREEVGRWVRKFNNLGEELGFTKPMPHEDVFKRAKQLVDVERWEGLLRDGLERVLRALFGAEAAAHAVGDIGTDSFEAVMMAVREKAEHANAWFKHAGGMPLEESRLKGSAVKTDANGWPVV